MGDPDQRGGDDPEDVDRGNGPADERLRHVTRLPGCRPHHGHPRGMSPQVRPSRDSGADSSHDAAPIRGRRRRSSAPSAIESDRACARRVPHRVGMRGRPPPARGGRLPCPLPRRRSPAERWRLRGQR
ncbi:MAG: hypothetical protein AVDCRST_MAG52-695 [uncultured Blastococcus sp.]|uniref:Uncharacterized protein n=1 Tax=uncultured Blastococcus sp. TaxID=217144 RepID=A0A6J4HHA5_9ACTN|nr:MAG: hypothetical protein AVDCRST_MAG52-695 [uncultured Blastococcus sp.]